MNERLDSVWDLLSARIQALEARVAVLERELVRDEVNDFYDALSEEDPDGWIGGTDD